ncbi:histidine kinase [Streptomyces sp. SID12488]|uniref:sensor histidine kinase n=1 Tax=Streptomyces sp. SID12488 TaxID=2706040 RepID=UPI0013DA1093|nr:histidine kinase [Streptomyces sp. SID12488]NEA64873.1 histidine kinase [Streptomyces sp. SID12488]
MDRGTGLTETTLPGGPEHRIRRKADLAPPATTFGRAALGARWPWAAWLVWTAPVCWALWFDYQAWGIDGFGSRTAQLACALLAVAAVAGSPWLGARALPVVGALVGVTSLAVSVLLRAGPGSSPDPVASDAYGLAEPAALLWLLLLVPLRGRRGWVAWVTPPVVWAAIVLRPLAVAVRENSVIVALFLAVGSTAVLGGGVAWRLVMADRRRRAATLRLEQRAEFARDLHDFVAHHVTGIVVQAQGALVIAQRRPELVPPALERIERAGSEALVSMRQMVGMLRDADGEPALVPLAGMAEVRSLVEGFSAVGGAGVRLELEGSFDDLPVEVTTTAHRVVMEALTNVRKHARGCTEVRVRAVRGGDGVTVRVSDDGRSRHPSGGGFGLRGLAERVNLVGGGLRTGPAAEGGWSVEATFPAAPVPASAPVRIPGGGTH